MAHTGTGARLLALCWAALLPGCSASHDRGEQPKDPQLAAQPDAASDASTGRSDAQPALTITCRTDDECILVARSCCDCGPTMDSVRSVRVGSEASAAPLCPAVCDPLAGALFCDAGHWQPGFDGPCWIH